jgi:hypothetical protein
MMLITSLVVPGVTAGSVFAQPVISIEGSCPTRLTFRWEGASADLPAALIVARETGQFTIPMKRCSSTELGLGSRGIRLLATFRTGAEGRGEVTGRANQALCGLFAQMLVIDGRPCPTSNVVQIPE